MNIQELIDFLQQNDEVGRNKPSTEVKIAMGTLKLKQEGFAQPLPDFYKLLRKFNGLSNNGCFILGINPESTMFPDLLDYNLRHRLDMPEAVILGYNDAFQLVYSANDEKYHIVDKDDGSEEGCSDNLADVVPYILHI